VAQGGHCALLRPPGRLLALHREQLAKNGHRALRDQTGSETTAHNHPLLGRSTHHCTREAFAQVAQTRQPAQNSRTKSTARVDGCLTFMVCSGWSVDASMSGYGPVSALEYRSPPGASRRLASAANPPLIIRL
jgi:hypothetical protein